MVSPCFQFERGQNFPFDWLASVSNILTVRKWAEPKGVIDLPLPEDELALPVAE